MSNAANREIVGQGLAFPLRLDSRGRFALATPERDVEEAVRVILTTIPGERLMRPEFGCRVHELVFAPRDGTTAGLAAYYVREAIERWEPRVALLAVDALVPTADYERKDKALESALLIHIKYEIKDTHDERSIVFPFFLSGDEGAGA